MIDRRDRTFLGALALLTVIYLFLFGYYLGATGLRVPVFDVIYWVIHYIDHWRTGDWWAYLWAPHNGHRLIWSRLLLVADLEWTGGSAIPFLVFGIACVIVLIGAILQEVWASALAPGPQATVSLLVVLLLASSYNAIDCGAPQLGVYLHTCAFAVLSLVLWGGAGEGGTWANARRIGALVAAVSAAFGVSGGLLIWPVLHWAAWRGKLGLRWIVVLWITGGCLIALYVPGMTDPGIMPSFDPMDFLHMADYVIRFLGLPWSHASALVDLGRVLGAATLSLGCYAILNFGIIHTPRSRLDRIAVGMLLFAFMMAAIITVGRVNIAPDREMPIRYTLFTSLAQVGLVLVAGPWLARLWATRRRGLIQAAILAGGVLFLVQQILAGQAGIEGVARYTMAYRDFEAGRTVPDLELLLGDRRSVERVLAYVHAHGLYRIDR